MLLVGAGILIGGFYYWYTSGTPGSTDTSAAPKRDPDQFEETLTPLRRLKNINFDQSLFKEPSFLILQKPTIPTAPTVTPGRANPFLPISNTTTPGEKLPRGRTLPSTQQ